jgi:UDP-2-acetamido-3-amino-2,3-dideoxy-glucuronate N-acetyltransferase
MAIRIHPTALVEDGVEIGDGTSIWDTVHIRAPSAIGRNCIIGEKTYIAYGVEIGDRVKINAFVYICTAVSIETGVMIAAGTVFTNDRFPRAATPDLSALRGSGPDEHTRPTRVRAGATIGARAVIGSELEIGRFAMIGMAAVVTRSVPDFHLVLGNPARSRGLVCRCGEPIARSQQRCQDIVGMLTCKACGLAYDVRRGRVTELTPPTTVAA